jgi:hypothetical protein
MHQKKCINLAQDSVAKAVLDAFVKLRRRQLTSSCLSVRLSTQLSLDGYSLNLMQRILYMKNCVHF